MVDSEAQVLSYLNEVYRPFVDPQNVSYSLEKVAIKDVYLSVISKTDCINKKSEIGFASWCSKRKVEFMNVPITRKRVMDSNKRFRNLYVMKTEYRGNKLLTHFQKYMHVN